jgi:hypothetical protein
MHKRSCFLLQQRRVRQILAVASELALKICQVNKKSDFRVIVRIIKNQKYLLYQKVQGRWKKKIASSLVQIVAAEQ